MIPYTLERRPDTNVSNTTLGLWLFLASEVMLFGALFSAYALLRVSAESWPSGRQVLNLPLAAANTAALAAAAFTMWRARSRPLAGATRALWAAAAAAIVFLAVQTIEYVAAVNAGRVPSASTFLAMYFTLTGLHAVHVLGGLAANAWAAAGRAGGAMTANRIRLLSVYWAFVALVWLVIVVLLYV